MALKLFRVTTISLSLHLLLKGQLSFLNQYYDVTGIASGEELLHALERREGIRTVEIKMKREICFFRDIRSLLSFIKLFYKEKPYIVHANTPKASLLSMLAAWLTRVPHRIYTVTGLRFETATGCFRRLLIIMERVTCWCATKVIPEGEGVKRVLISEGITHKPLQVILYGNINGIDIDYFDKTKEVLAIASTLRQVGCFTFCFVGRMVKDKGLNELIRSFVKLSSKHTDVRLILVGALERELDPLDREVEEILLHHSSIMFVGYQQDIRPYLVASDVLVFPSYREGFPNVVLQAGAMGLPAIVTDINGCNEIIEDGVNGVIIPSKNEDALFKAMMSFCELESGIIGKMSRNARSRIVERYEQQRLWNAFLHEYQQLK